MPFLCFRTAFLLLDTVQTIDNSVTFVSLALLKTRMVSISKDNVRVVKNSIAKKSKLFERSELHPLIIAAVLGLLGGSRRQSNLRYGRSAADP